MLDSIKNTLKLAFFLKNVIFIKHKLFLLMNHSDLLIQFWSIFTQKGPAAATKFCNLYSNGLAVPTFMKIRPLNSSAAYTCINIQEYLHSKHIDGLMLGYEYGICDPRTANIWYRLMREANLTIQDEQFPKFNTNNLKITFHKVQCLKRGNSGPEQVIAGYIIFDYTIL